MNLLISLGYIQIPFRPVLHSDILPPGSRVPNPGSLVPWFLSQPLSKPVSCKKGKRRKRARPTHRKKAGKQPSSESGERKKEKEKSPKKGETQKEASLNPHPLQQPRGRHPPQPGGRRKHLQAGLKIHLSWRRGARLISVDSGSKGVSHFPPRPVSSPSEPAAVARPPGPARLLAAAA